MFSFHIGFYLLLSAWANIEGSLSYFIGEAPASKLAKFLLFYSPSFLFSFAASLAKTRDGEYLRYSESVCIFTPEEA